MGGSTGVCGNVLTLAVRKGLLITAPICIHYWALFSHNSTNSYHMNSSDMIEIEPPYVVLGSLLLTSRSSSFERRLKYKFLN